MSNQNSRTSAIDVYTEYVSNLQSTLNNIVQLQSRIEQNLNSIVENEIYHNLRAQLYNSNPINGQNNNNEYNNNQNNTNQNNRNQNNRNQNNTNQNNRYSTRNFNEHINVSIPSPPGSPPLQQPRLSNHIPIPRFVTNAINNNPIMNRRHYVPGTPYRTYFTTNNPTFTFNPYNEVRHGSGRRPTTTSNKRRYRKSSF